MEGKGVLFKRFADIDVFDVELDVDGVDEMVDTVRPMEPTFGGVNVEDVAAPECFEIERRLSEEMDVPVFHDDQHGTAIISGAALLNAVDIADKELSDVEVIFAGAGAAALASARFYVSLGVDPENITMADEGGIITESRVAEEGLHEYVEPFANPGEGGTLADAMDGADVFVGLAVGGIVDQEMVRSMADTPILFAMANPDPGSDTRRRKRPATTPSSWRPGAPITPTRSTTSWDSCSSSAGPWTSGPPTSTRR